MRLVIRAYDRDHEDLGAVFVENAPGVAKLDPIAVGDLIMDVIHAYPVITHDR